MAAPERVQIRKAPDRTLASIGRPSHEDLITATPRSFVSGSRCRLGGLGAGAGGLGAREVEVLESAVIVGTSARKESPARNRDDRATGIDERADTITEPPMAPVKEHQS